MALFTLFDNIPPIVRGDEQVKARTKPTPKSFTCADCALNESALTPKLSPRGRGGRGVLIVGDSPSPEEDREGKFGNGVNTVFIKNTLADIGINLFKDCWYTTATICYSGKSKPACAVNACRRHLQATINTLKPKAIILLGNSAFQSAIAPQLVGRIRGASASDFRGEVIPDQTLKTWIIPTYSPADLRDRRTYEDGEFSAPLYERDPSQMDAFRKHLLAAFHAAGKPFYEHNYHGDCLITTEESQAIRWLEDALSWKQVSFDYETNAKKPYREGSRIICVSISDGLFSYAFPFFESRDFRRAYRRLMLSDIPKISHNLQFENTWTREKLGYWVSNWKDDTMLSQHCLQNQKPTNLKFCSFTEFGIIGYDEAMDPYITSIPAEVDVYGENAFNRMAEAPIEDVLLYCALDSLLTAKLAGNHRARMDKLVLNGYEFFVESAESLAWISHNGMRIDDDAFTRAEDMLNAAITAVEKEFYDQPEVQRWDGSSPVSLTSPPQLSHLVFDILGVAPIKYTEKKKPSLDNKTIEKLNLHFLNLVMKHRELCKMRSTVIVGWRREAINGIVHPSFNLNTVVTFRSSSTAPNAQNNYKRDPEKKKISRSIIVPRKGHKIAEYDFKGLEVVINACHSRDKNLIKYINDPTTDMHLEATMDCLIMDAIDAKKHRGAVKGLFVFSEFYGNWYGQVARDLWQYIQEEKLLPHMRKNGIKTYEQFEEHIKEAERILWEDRFPEHRKWMKSQYTTYLKDGYLETHTGFRPQGPMKRNVAYNIKVQGDGFHVLMWAINQIKKKMQTLEYSMIIDEIHDSIVVDMHPSEEAMIDYWVWYYCTKAVRKHWPWIILPLQVEKESTEVDCSWDTMSPRGMLKGPVDGE